MININHVTLAASALATLTESRETIDLPPNCGGVYGNGVTEMAVLVFCHGSHTECISTVEWDASSPLWHDYIRADGGPCAQALRTVS